MRDSFSTMPTPSVKPALPKVASKAWSCSELETGNAKLLASKVEQTGDPQVVSAYADQLKARIQAG